MTEAGQVGTNSTRYTPITSPYRVTFDLNPDHVDSFVNTPPVMYPCWRRHDFFSKGHPPRLRPSPLL